MAQTIISITLDETAVRVRTPEIEHERRTAIMDLLAENHFTLKDRARQGKYSLHLSIVEQRLLIDILENRKNAQPIRLIVSLAGFRKLIRDYFMICESYFEAIKLGNPSRIEAIDMGRRGMHNEGAALLAEMLSDKAMLDNDTARRLFTLICILHIR